MHTRAVCTRNARVRTVALHALSVCTVVYVVLLLARGVSARLSPSAEAGKMPHLQPLGSICSHHE